MLRVEESIAIKRPIANVFAYLGEASNWPYWTSEVLKVKQASAGQVGVGTTFQGVDRTMGFKVAWASRISEYQNPSLLILNLKFSKYLGNIHLFLIINHYSNYSFCFSHTSNVHAFNSNACNCPISSASSSWII